MGYVSRLKVAVYSYLQALLGFFSAFLFGQGKGVVDSLEKSLDFSETSVEFACGETETETVNMCEEISDGVRSADSEFEGVKESNGGFTFRFPTYEEFINGRRGTGIGCETVDSEPLLQSGSKYEFMSEKGFSGFIAEQEVVKQVNLAFKDVCLEDEDTVGFNKDLKQSHSEEDVSNEENEDSDIHVCSKEGTEVTKLEENKDVKQSHSEGEDVSNEENGNSGSDVCSREETEVTNLGEEKREFGKAESHSQCDLDFIDGTSFQSEKDSLITDSESASLSFEHMKSLMGRLVDSYSEGLLSDEDFRGDFKLDDSKGMDTEESHDDEMSEENQEFDTSDQDDSAIMDEYLEEFKQDGNESLETVESEFLSENDFHEDAGNLEDWELDDSAVMEEGLEEFKQDGDDSLDTWESEFLSENDFREGEGKLEDWESDDEFTNNTSESANLMSENKSDLDYEDANKMESLWEHQDLLEQIKMELRKVRATGLPTIFEESDAPKMDDLKPWKIDERFQRQDCIGELMKFNKSYRERMRKFDILTYQKLYAIGFLQKDPQKDPFQLLSSQKSSGPALKSLKNVWPFKHKSSEIDPVAKFIKEIQCELEVVYVGQMCLSWEFLHWQYGKALDLWDSDPRGIHRYNEVAGEFQQFQVLLQRFIEDEPFQKPRVQYYIKSRYDFRNLLQVPVIREDNLKDKKKAMKFEKGDFAITSDILVEILEECIRIFWRFVKADNDSSTVPVKCHKGVHPEIENADDLELLMEVQRSLQKKERKLRDTLRSENCVLRRFRRCRDNEDDDSDHVLYFFSQVDMKLVSRVLNMSRLTTEQLVWCHNKLSRIRFVNRRIQVEPSFLLFPC